MGGWNIFGWKVRWSSKTLRAKLKAVVQELMPDIWGFVFGDYVPGIPDERQAWEWWKAHDSKIHEAYSELSVEDQSRLDGGGAAAFIKLLRHRLDI